MELQVAPHRGQEHDPRSVGLHHSGEGEDDGQHHEKKSVLKKVKAKAKKIKETITKHGHGHEHDHDHGGREGEEDDGDDEEELVEDPELHGAPMYEAAAMRSAVAGQVDNPNVGFGRPTGITLDQNPSAPKGTISRSVETSGKTTIIKEADDSGVEPNTTLSLSPGVSDWTNPIDNPGRTGQPGQSNVNLRGPMSLEEDPHAPKDRTQADAPRNYEIKVTDLARRGSKEAGASGILDSFAKMKINDEKEVKPKSGDESDQTQKHYSDLSTGSHDEFSPEPNPRTLDAAVPENHPGDQSSYTQKMSAATSAVADKAISAKDYIASKFRYGGKYQGTSAHEMHEASGDGTKSAASSPLEYGKKIAATVTEKLSPVYEKVTETGSTVISKAHGTVTGPESDSAAKGQDKGVSVKDYLAQKLKPGEEDRALSEVISDALHKRKEEGQSKGEVTESEVVAMQLGSDDDGRNEKREGSSDMNEAAAATGKSVVGKLKDTVASWLGKAGESRTSHQSVGSSQGVEGFAESSPVGEATQRQARGGAEAEVRILQESSN